MRARPRTLRAAAGGGRLARPLRRGAGGRVRPPPRQLPPGLHPPGADQRRLPRDRRRAARRRRRHRGLQRDGRRPRGRVVGTRPAHASSRRQKLYRQNLSFALYCTGQDDESQPLGRQRTADRAAAPAAPEDPPRRWRARPDQPAPDRLRPARAALQRQLPRARARRLRRRHPGHTKPVRGSMQHFYSPTIEEPWARQVLGLSEDGERAVGGEDEPLPSLGRQTMDEAEENLTRKAADDADRIGPPPARPRPPPHPRHHRRAGPRPGGEDAGFGARDAIERAIRDLDRRRPPPPHRRRLRHPDPRRRPLRRTPRHLVLGDARRGSRCGGARRVRPRRRRRPDPPRPAPVTRTTSVAAKLPTWSSTAWTMSSSPTRASATTPTLASEATEITRSLLRRAARRLEVGRPAVEEADPRRRQSIITSAGWSRLPSTPADRRASPTVSGSSTGRLTTTSSATALGAG